MMQFIKNNIWLIGLALGSGVMLVWPVLRRQLFGIGEVSPNEAVMLANREQALMLDVREDAEFATGHIPEARHIPLGQLLSRVGELDAWKDKPIVVNCQSGMRSATACALLRKQGFTKLFNLGGGFAAWQAAKLPSTRD
jgi:rhodanese-related sulfurtransferase